MTLMAEAKGSTIESGWTECVEAKRLRDAFPAPEGVVTSDPLRR